MVARAKAEEHTTATQSASFFNARNVGLFSREAAASPFFTPSNNTSSNSLIQTSRENETSASNNHTSSAPEGLLQLQTATPEGPDPCLSLLERIIFLLDELAQRINDGLDDRHNLYKFHRRLRDSHPEHGSWEGHRQRFETERQELRDRLNEWDNNCRGFMPSPQQQEDLNEAYEYKDREFPAEPAQSNKRVVEETEMDHDMVRHILIRSGVPEAAAATLTVMIIIALADPEPFTKVAALIGSAAAVIFFIILGDSSQQPEEA